MCEEKWIWRFGLTFFVTFFRQGKKRKNKLSFLGSSKKSYSLFLLSIKIVTGPSLTKVTFMSAPNTPVFIGF